MAFYQIDENGFLMFDVTEKEAREMTKEERAKLITVPCPDGLYRPKYTQDGWVEGLSDTEVKERETLAENAHTDVLEGIRQEQKRLSESILDLVELVLH